MFGLCNTMRGTLRGGDADAAPVELALGFAGWQNIDQ